MNDIDRDIAVLERLVATLKARRYFHIGTPKQEETMAYWADQGLLYNPMDDYSLVDALEFIRHGCGVEG